MAEANYGGYNFVPKNETAYECAICKKIIRLFTKLPCEHAACKSCLENWEKKNFQMSNQINEG